MKMTHKPPWIPGGVYPRGNGDGNDSCPFPWWIFDGFTLIETDAGIKFILHRNEVYFDLITDFEL